MCRITEADRAARSTVRAMMDNVWRNLSRLDGELADSSQFAGTMPNKQRSHRVLASRWGVLTPHPTVIPPEPESRSPSHRLLQLQPLSFCLTKSKPTHPAMPTGTSAIEDRG